MRKITTENWGRAPFNRTSFKQVQALFPTARICRGGGPYSTLAKRSCDVLKVPCHTITGELSTVGEMLKQTFTDAFLVMHNGELIAEEYAHGMNRHSHHLLNSVSKSFAGMLAGILVEKNLLTPGDLVTRYLPEFAPSAFSATTVQQLLDMTAAVKYGEDYAQADADFWVEAAVVGWRPALVNDASAKTLFDYAAGLSESGQGDGEAFDYRTVLTNVLCMVLERAANKSIPDLLQHLIWEKLGPDQDASVVVDRAGFPYMGAGMSACARDLARFGQLLLNNGSYNRRQIVPAQWVEQTLQGSDQLRAHFAQTDYSMLFPGGHYSNQCWANRDQQLLVCLGIHGQTIYVSQATGVVIVKLSSHPQPVDTSLYANTLLAFAALSESLNANGGLNHS